MITITPNTNLGLAQLASDPYKMVKIARDVHAKQIQYTIAHRDTEAPALALISIDQFNTLLSVNPSKSLPVYYQTLNYDTVSAGLKIEEIYHLVLGLSLFPGNLSPNTTLEESGFEHHIVSQGQKLPNIVENKVSSGGAVTASYPIASLDSVSATKAGGTLTVHSIPNLNLGVVDLYDGGSPIADGIAVELTYETIGYVVAQITDVNKQVIAVICSEGLLNYLVAND